MEDYERRYFSAFSQWYRWKCAGEAGGEATILPDIDRCNLFESEKGMVIDFQINSEVKDLFT